MKKIFFSLLLAFISIAGCQQKPVLNYPAISEISGLATPLELEYDETLVVLEDYFTDISRIDSFTVPYYLSYKLTGDDFEFLSLKTKEGDVPYFGELKVWVDGFPYSLLLKKNRKINYQFRFDPGGMKYKTVQPAGTLNDWNPAGTVLAFADGAWQTNLLLNPGFYHYQLVLDGKWVLDPNNPVKADNNMGGFNSVLNIGNTNYASLPSLFTVKSTPVIHIGYTQNMNDVFVFWENSRLDDRFVKKVENGFEITLPYEAGKMSRSFIRIWGYNENGPSNDLLIPVSKGKVITNPAQLTREDKHATILYFMMIDRFKNGNPENDDPIIDPEIAPRAN